MNFCSMVISSMGTPSTITVKHVERLGPKAVRLTLDPGARAKEWRNIPGGYMTFCLPCGDPILHRSYSLVQAPDAVFPQVVVKETGGSRGSAFVNRQFKPGMEVMAYPPQGRLFPSHWDEEPIHAVMFAAGAGITPMYSVMQHLLASPWDHEITLFYGNRGVSDILLRDELEVLAALPQVTVKHILTDESLEDELYNGRINASKTMLLWNEVVTDLPIKAMVSGPVGMKKDVLRGLDLAGIPAENIRVEDFHHPPHLEAATAQSCAVSATMGSQEVTFDYCPQEESLVEAITKRGIHVPVSCRGGVCGSCSATVVEGEVAVEHSYALTNKERKDGMVLCCQARPVSDHVKLSFKRDQ